MNAETEMMKILFVIISVTTTSVASTALVVMGSCFILTTELAKVMFQNCKIATFSIFDQNNLFCVIVGFSSNLTNLHV